MKRGGSSAAERRGPSRRSQVTSPAPRSKSPAPAEPPPWIQAQARQLAYLADILGELRKMNATLPTLSGRSR